MTEIDDHLTTVRDRNRRDAMRSNLRDIPTFSDKNKEDPVTYIARLKLWARLNRYYPADAPDKVRMLKEALGYALQDGASQWFYNNYHARDIPDQAALEALFDAFINQYNRSGTTDVERYLTWERLKPELYPNNFVEFAKMCQQVGRDLRLPADAIVRKVKMSMPNLEYFVFRDVNNMDDIIQGLQENLVRNQMNPTVQKPAEAYLRMEEQMQSISNTQATMMDTLLAYQRNQAKREESSMDSGQQSAKSSNGQRRLACWTCGSFDHLQNECPDYQQQQKGKRRGGFKGNNRGGRGRGRGRGGFQNSASRLPPKFRFRNKREARENLRSLDDAIDYLVHCTLSDNEDEDYQGN